ncbi:MAG: Holliday junction branch migration protein RuvA [Gammaproteobacteria bacterium]
MIGFLNGKLAFKQPPELVIDVGGVGYELFAPMSTFYELPNVGETVSVYTHLAVSENAHTLYGFAGQKDRLMFRALIKVSGVGPKLAMTILSGISPAEFADAIAERDIDRLVRLPGIGKKTAERLLVEMKDPLAKLNFGVPGAAVAGASDASDEAFSALQALGYKEAEVRRLLKGVKVDGLTTEDLIRQALKNSTK